MQTRNLRGWLGDPLDFLPAVVIFSVGLVDIIAFAPSDALPIDAPPLANTFFLALVCVPLIWRRRAPILTASVISAATVLWPLVLADRKTDPPFEAFFAALLVIYTVASGTAGWRTGAGLAVLSVLILGDVASMRSGRPVENTVPAWIFAAIAFAVGRVAQRQRALAAGLAERTQQLEREREERAQRAVAFERARIARELHDLVTHNVSLMVLQASVELRTSQGASPSWVSALRTIEETGRQTLAELRRLVGVLRHGDEPSPLEPQPTLAALPELIEHTRVAGLRTSLDIEGTPRPLPIGLELSVYRVVQEALTNTLKHAQAQSARVRITYSDSAIEVEVVDDGRGLGHQESPGYGVLGMRERARLYDGVLDIAAGAGGSGCRVRAWFPAQESGT